MSNFKMVGDKKYTLSEKGTYLDKDGYGSKALGYQIPQKVRKNAQGEWELASKKKKKKPPTGRPMKNTEYSQPKSSPHPKKMKPTDDNKTSIDPKLYGDMLKTVEGFSKKTTNKK
jgi:glucan-binding YG repeat protein